MSENKYDSVLVGFTEEPRTNEQGEIIAWSVKLKDHELKEMLDNYVTQRNEKGHGGNVYLKLFMSKNGKACCSVFNPNSEAAKDNRLKKEEANSSVSSDEDDELPF